MSNNSNIKTEFKNGDFVVYPTHGVGQIEAIEKQEIAGTSLDIIVVNFSKEKMKLRLPVAKAVSVGLRKIVSKEELQNAFAVLKKPGKVKKLIWSRRAQEYDAKINSGDIKSLAEVIRDLHLGNNGTEQSYSERQLYLAAINRLAREVAIIESLDVDQAIEKVESILKSRTQAQEQDVA